MENKLRQIDGIVFSRRPASGACPSGAWFSPHFHTSKHSWGWHVWETGKREIGIYRTAEQAKTEMIRLEKGA